MTDKETSLAFVVRMERSKAQLSEFTFLTPEQVDLLLRLAKTAALIEEHRLDVMFATESNVAIYEPKANWKHVGFDNVHEAVRAVADKIKEGK